jgi:DNA-binding MarR family transcriptional regulator
VKLQQTSLFTPAPFSDSDTSRDAAKAIIPHIERLEAAVLDALVLTGGACAFEVQERLGMAGDTVRPRLVSLEAKGLAVKTPHKRLTPSGRWAAIWVANDSRVPRGASWPE